MNRYVRRLDGSLALRRCWISANISVECCWLDKVLQCSIWSRHWCLHSQRPPAWKLLILSFYYKKHAFYCDLWWWLCQSVSRGPELGGG